MTASDSDDVYDDANVDACDPSRGALVSLLKRMEVSSYSTAFSGIDSPGTSFAQLRASVCSCLHIDPSSIVHPHHLHAIDPCLRLYGSFILHILALIFLVFYRCSKFALQIAHTYSSYSCDQPSVFCLRSTMLYALLLMQVVYYGQQ